MNKKSWVILLGLLTISGILAGCNCKSIPSASPRSGKAPLTVVFDGSASTAQMASIVRYQWDFGDGTRKNGRRVIHKYDCDKAKCTYRARLTVEDSGGCVEVSNPIMITVVPDHVKPPTGNTVPAWAPDGVRIAFVSTRDGNEELYLINVNTMKVSRVTNNEAKDTNPSWTPGGELIAFCSNRDGQKGLNIYTINPLEKTVTRLTHGKDVTDCGPSWTPTTEAEVVSKYIVFHSNRDGNFEIYKMHIETTATTRLTVREKADDKNTTISPDGSKIAFQSKVGGNWEVFVMDSDGRNVKRITFNPADDTTPIWSPTGNKIAFTSTRDKNEEIYTMDIDGKNVRNLTNNNADDANPTWSPQAKFIAFSSDRTGSLELWKMTKEGVEHKQLTGLE